MFTIQDETRHPSRIRIVTVAIIVVNTLVFMLEIVGGEDFVTKWSLIPADVVAGHQLVTIVSSAARRFGMMLGAFT